MHDLTKPRILIIDDIPDNVLALGGVLEGAYEVQFAMSGPDGLELARQHAPDLILLDVMMPEMDGYAVFAELQREPKLRDIPVIFVTALSDADNETRALAAGAVDFIHKPINPLVVRSRVNTQMALKRRELELCRINAELDDRVKQRTSELEERTRQVETLNDALEERALQAEAANLAKRYFLGNMSHELRTPLNAIIGFTELLQRKTIDSWFLQRLGNIDKAAHQLAATIHDILSFTEIDAGQLKPTTVDFELPTVMQRIGILIEPRAAAKNLTHTVEFDPAIPASLSGDPGKLEQVILNLVGNAVKFTHQGGVRVRVGLIQANKTEVNLRLEVQDTGIGIDPSKLKTIFQPFEQSDNSLTREYGGIGLGLSINWKLVEMMGGEMGVDSEIGKGSTFWATFRFPPSQALPAKPLQLPSLEALKAHHADAKLLLVEDDCINQEILTELLSEAGLQADIANDGAEAVARATAKDYRLILMDVQMPIMDGLDATRAIRNLPGREQTVIIAVSANAYDDDKQRCFEAGMDAFLAKPLSPETLYQTLAKWLDKPA